MNIHKYMYVCVHVCVSVCEKERERDKEMETVTLKPVKCGITGNDLAVTQKWPAYQKLSQRSR